MAKTNTVHLQQTIKKHVIPGHGTGIHKLAKLSGLDIEVVKDIALRLERKKGSGIVVIKPDWIIIIILLRGRYVRSNRYF